MVVLHYPSDLSATRLDCAVRMTLVDQNSQCVYLLYPKLGMTSKGQGPELSWIDRVSLKTPKPDCQYITRAYTNVYDPEVLRQNDAVFDRVMAHADYYVHAHCW